MITQNDVTMRTRLEIAMAALTDSQLGMLSQVCMCVWGMD